MALYVRTDLGSPASQTLDNGFVANTPVLCRGVTSALRAYVYGYARPGLVPSTDTAPQTFGRSYSGGRTTGFRRTGNAEISPEAESVHRARSNAGYIAADHR